VTGGWKKIHPFPLFVYYSGVVLFSMLLLHPLYLVTGALYMSLFWILTGRKHNALRTLRYYLLTGLAVALFNPLFSHRGATILFYMFDQPVTLESIVYGLFMMLSLLTVLFAFQSGQQVLTGDKMFYLFAWAAPRATLAVRMAMRFVPLLLDRWKRVAEAQRTQGLSFGEGTWKQKAADGMKLVSLLLTWSLEEAIVTARSMRARGYGTGKRTSYPFYRMRRQDWTVLSGMIVTAIVICAGKYAGYGTLTVYPRLAPFSVSGLEWFVYTAYCVFLAIPLYVQGKEHLLWRCWKFKTSLSPTPMRNVKR